MCVHYDRHCLGAGSINNPHVQVLLGFSVAERLGCPLALFWLKRPSGLKVTHAG